MDYSRFKDIGQEDREERLQSGDVRAQRVSRSEMAQVTWEELKKEEKKQAKQLGRCVFYMASQ